MNWVSFLYGILALLFIQGTCATWLVTRIMTSPMGKMIMTTATASRRAAKTAKHSPAGSVSMFGKRPPAA